MSLRQEAKGLYLQDKLDICIVIVVSPPRHFHELIRHSDVLRIHSQILWRGQFVELISSRKTTPRKASECRLKVPGFKLYFYLSIQQFFPEIRFQWCVIGRIIIGSQDEITCCCVHAFQDLREPLGVLDTEL